MADTATYTLKFEHAPGQACASPQFALSAIFRLFEDLQLDEEQQLVVVETLITIYAMERP